MKTIPSRDKLLAMDQSIIDSIVEAIGVIESAAAEITVAQLYDAIAASIRIEREETDPKRR